jgi:two-component system chemotaxis response regulator CheY
MAYNILIVDDSATIRAVIKRTIGMAGVSTGKLFEAANGKLALEVLKSNPVDVVFADLNMPEMGGVELTSNIRGNPAWNKLPVVIVSSESMEKRIAILQAQGISGYIHKPFTPEQIRNVIEQVLKVPNAA